MAYFNLCKVGNKGHKTIRNRDGVTMTYMHGAGIGKVIQHTQQKGNFGKGKVYRIGISKFLYIGI